MLNIIINNINRLNFINKVNVKLPHKEEEKNHVLSNFVGKTSMYAFSQKEEN